MGMECFFIENGTERKAGLEDLLLLIREGWVLENTLRGAYISKIDLAAAIALLPDRIKEMVYRNVSPRVGGMLKKFIDTSEARYSKEYMLLEEARLIDHIGERALWYIDFPKHVIWKETEPKKEKTPKPSLAPLEVFIRRIEEACENGRLDMTYSIEQITRQEIQNAFEYFLDNLYKIRSFAIKAKDLPAAALLFETGKIEELHISGDAEDEWPPFLKKCNALTQLSIYFTNIASLPDWIGDLQFLTWLSLYDNKNLKALPGSIGNLKNLIKLDISSSPIESLPDSIGNLKNLQELSFYNLDIKEMPDWIGGLYSLTRLSLSDNKNLKALPASIGNLKNLDYLHVYISPIESLPDSIGNLRNLHKLTLSNLDLKEIPECIGGLQSLTELVLDSNQHLRTLPDSIGNLKNLAKLDIGYSPIESLPDTITNCTALESVVIFGTKITTVPDFILNIKYFKDNKLIETIPDGCSVSWRCFCNSFYRLAEVILRFNGKARREGLLALEEEVEYLADGFFKKGIRLVVDGTDAEIIRKILLIKLERENDPYRKKLMEAALEGILCIQNRDSDLVTVFKLASLVDMENSPLEAACAKYLAGDVDAIEGIDFSTAIQPEGEREEIRFIKRVMELSEVARREGFNAMEKHLDHEGIAARDVFEYGIRFLIDGWDPIDIAKILDNLISLEKDPLRKNFAQAKKEAVMGMSEGDGPRVLLETLCSYFDGDIAEEMASYSCHL